jgi:16S rRNA (guanine966-N2)-methyltransferase
MRITGGELAGRHIPTKFASHVRPTTDRVRESIFNLIAHNYPQAFGQVLDLYSGSGIISLESISRGAEHITSIDSDSKNITNLKEICSNWDISNWTIHRNKTERFIKNCNQSYDLIFADPPYDLAGINNLPELIIPLLNPGGIFIFEHQPNLVPSMAATQVKNYGSTVCSIFATSP